MDFLSRNIVYWIRWSEVNEHGRYFLAHEKETVKLFYLMKLIVNQFKKGLCEVFFIRILRINVRILPARMRKIYVRGKLVMNFNLAFIDITNEVVSTLFIWFVAIRRFFENFDGNRIKSWKESVQMFTNERVEENLPDFEWELLAIQI